MEQIDHLENLRNSLEEIEESHEVYITVNVNGETRECLAIYRDGEIVCLDVVGRKLEELVEEMI